MGLRFGGGGVWFDSVYGVSAGRVQIWLYWQFCFRGNYFMPKPTGDKCRLFDNFGSGVNIVREVNVRVSTI